MFSVEQPTLSCHINTILEKKFRNFKVLVVIHRVEQWSNKIAEKRHVVAFQVHVVLKQKTYIGHVLILAVQRIQEGVTTVVAYGTWIGTVFEKKAHTTWEMQACRWLITLKGCHQKGNAIAFHMLCIGSI